MEENTNATAGAQTGVQGAAEGGNGQGQKQTTQTDGRSGSETPKTYTADELQAETERRVAEALKNATAQADFEKKLHEEKAQWEKESKMTAAEREKAAKQSRQAVLSKSRLQRLHIQPYSVNLTIITTLTLMKQICRRALQRLSLKQIGLPI